jgi:hypothetical protein
VLRRVYILMRRRKRNKRERSYDCTGDRRAFGVGYWVFSMGLHGRRYTVKGTWLYSFGVYTTVYGHETTPDARGTVGNDQFACISLCNEVTVQRHVTLC